VGTTGRPSSILMLTWEKLSFSLQRGVAKHTEFIFFPSKRGSDYLSASHLFVEAANWLDLQAHVSTLHAAGSGLITMLYRGRHSARNPQFEHLC
jgi:hypothetical protein